MQRPPAVAGLFDPDTPGVLRLAVDGDWTEATRSCDVVPPSLNDVYATESMLA